MTAVGDFEHTILAYKQMFKQYGMSDCWRDIIAIVVQTGVDFGDNRIKIYDRDKAADLCNKLKQYPDIVFEGHSTDFQPPQKLREMVQDGIAIIKVGPALSYAIREGLFALASMEKELIDEVEMRSNLKEILEEEMLKNPKYWQPYYRGSQRQNAVARKYSFSDRSRYYFTQPRLEKAVQTLFKNIDSVEIPLGLLHQYMPMQYRKVRDGLLPPNAKALVKEAVIRVIDAYNYAVKCNYLMEGE